MIIWLRQPDGAFQRSGELPKGTRYVLVQMLSDGDVWVGNSRKSASAGVSLIQGAIASGHVRRKGYRVVPATPSSEETRARFAEVRAAHRRKRGLDSPDNKGCGPGTDPGENATAKGDLTPGAVDVADTGKPPEKLETE